MSKPYSVCLIGNSHVAALKMAWSKRAPKLADGFSLRFFSAQNYMMAHIALKGRMLVPGRADLAEKLRFTSDGLDRIELDDYDAFVIVGSGFGIDVPKLRGVGGAPSHLGFARIDNLVSEACFDAVLEATFAGTHAISLIDMIRQVTQAPIVLVGAPFMSERLLEDDEIKDDLHMKDRAALGPYIARARAIAERVAAARGADVIWQDESTVAMPGFTRHTFNRGAVRFNLRDGAMPEFDDKHGNEDYGHLVMTKVVARLDELSGGRVLAA
ncbi:MAG TPA: hypothetical protein VG889_14985 [Rhizomicrobium sp.]|nr:hypothetical protein [Rhizomicrobium sp.]